MIVWCAWKDLGKGIGVGFFQVVSICFIGFALIDGWRDRRLVRFAAAVLPLGGSDMQISVIFLLFSVI